MSKHLAWSEYPSHVNDWHGSGHALCSDPTAIICQILKIVFIFRLPNWKRWPNISSFQKYQAKRSGMFNKSLEETNTKRNWIWTSSTKKSLFFEKKLGGVVKRKKNNLASQFFVLTSSRAFFQNCDLFVVCSTNWKDGGKTGFKIRKFPIFLTKDGFWYSHRYHYSPQCWRVSQI